MRDRAAFKSNEWQTWHSVAAQAAFPRDRYAGKTHPCSILPDSASCISQPRAACRPPARARSRSPYQALATPAPGLVLPGRAPLLGHFQERLPANGAGSLELQCIALQALRVAQHATAAARALHNEEVHEAWRHTHQKPQAPFGCVVTSAPVAIVLLAPHSPSCTPSRPCTPPLPTSQSWFSASVRALSQQKRRSLTLKSFLMAAAGLW